MKRKKFKKSGFDELLSAVITVVVKFFIYFTVYIRHFKKPKIHLFGFFMAIAAVIFLPNRYINGCSTAEWFLLLISTSFVFSGAVSGYVYAESLSAKKK